MSIELPANGFGFTLFLIILGIFECFFALIGSSVSNFFHLVSWVWWIVALSIFLILNMIFVNVKL